MIGYLSHKNLFFEFKKNLNKMKKLYCSVLFCALVFLSFGQSKEPFILYNAKGKKVSYKKMMKGLQDADVILFGELHNNPITHWLQYEVTNDLAGEKDLVLGAEMIEADNQDELDLYLAGEINYGELDSMARLWPNYKTDYAPLVEIAKSNKVPFIGTNIPRRYASQVFYEGFEALETLPAEEKAWIAPLPIAYDPELPGYKAMLEMAMGGHGGENFPKAQAIKDATMAHFILENVKEGSTFIHYNGAYHSDNYEGILWYLKKGKEELTYKTITTVLQADVSKLSAEYLNRADFIICVDENMTTTY